MLKAKDLRNDNLQELQTKLGGMLKQHMELRFQQASGTLKNPLEIRQIKRDIARLNLVISEKQNDEK